MCFARIAARASGSETEGQELRASGHCRIRRRERPITRERSHARLDFARADPLPGARGHDRVQHGAVATDGQLHGDLAPQVRTVSESELRVAILRLLVTIDEERRRNGERTQRGVDELVDWRRDV